MSRRTESIHANWFEELYAADADPWKFATSDYEREKYAHTLAALPHAHYARALEVGCSIGVLTERLAMRCNRLLAIDAADTPLRAAQNRCRDLAHVEFARMYVPGQWPKETFDLILLSEVVYYLNAADVAALAGRIAASTSPGATLALVHWTGESDYPLTGDQAAEMLAAALGDRVDVAHSERRSQYRLDVLTIR